MLPQTSHIGNTSLVLPLTSHFQLWAQRPGFWATVSNCPPSWCSYRGRVSDKVAREPILKGHIAVVLHGEMRVRLCKYQWRIAEFFKYMVYIHSCLIAGMVCIWLNHHFSINTKWINWRDHVNYDTHTRAHTHCQVTYEPCKELNWRRASRLGAWQSSVKAPIGHFRLSYVTHGH